MKRSWMVGSLADPSPEKCHPECVLMAKQRLGGKKYDREN